MNRSLALLLFALAACNSDPAAPLTIEQTTFAPALGVNLAASTKTASGMYYRDLTVGGGALLQSGHIIGVHYVGNLPDNTLFDANIAPTTPFSFTLGAHQVISGFEEGITGMHVGGVRQLIIPPELGYGSGSQGPIPPNAILVFTVTVVTTN